VVLLGVGGLVVADQGLNFFEFLVGEDADHGHHAHHACAPVGGEAVGFGLGDTLGVVHGHFHEGVLRKAGDGVGIFGDGGVVHVFDPDVAGERFHLAEGLCIGGVRGLDLAIAEQVHHAVHHVMRKMAVNHPVAGIFGFELDDFGLCDADEDSIGGVPGGFGGAAAFRTGDHELVAVKMNGVVIHAKVDEPEAHAAAEARDERCGGGSGEAVEGEPVEFHGGGVGNGVGRKKGPFLEDDGVIVIGVRRVGRLRMGDEESDEADHFLHGAVGVVEKSAFLVDSEFVSVGFTGRDGFLADEGDAVLFDGHFEAVPVHGGAFGKRVFDDDADAVTLRDLDSGAGAGAVVAPGVDGFEGCDFAFHGFGAEAKNFCDAVESEGEVGNVGSDDRNVGMRVRVLLPGFRF